MKSINVAGTEYDYSISADQKTMTIIRVLDQAWHTARSDDPIPEESVTTEIMIGKFNPPVGMQTYREMSEDIQAYVTFGNADRYVTKMSRWNKRDLYVFDEHADMFVNSDDIMNAIKRYVGSNPCKAMLGEV